MLRRSINAWKMLMLSLPKGIIAFVIAVTGLCVSLPLVIIWVGLPLLALTLTWCRTMMISEQKAAEAWSHGKGGPRSKLCQTIRLPSAGKVCGH